MSIRKILPSLLVLFIFPFFSGYTFAEWDDDGFEGANDTPSYNTENSPTHDEVAKKDNGVVRQVVTSNSDFGIRISEPDRWFLYTEGYSPMGIWWWARVGDAENTARMWVTLVQKEQAQKHGDIKEWAYKRYTWQMKGRGIRRGYAGYAGGYPYTEKISNESEQFVMGNGVKATVWISEIIINNRYNWTVAYASFKHPTQDLWGFALFTATDPRDLDKDAVKMLLAGIFLTKS